MTEQKRLVNPFKPTAGMTPPMLIGRESVLDDFADALDEGAGAPGRLMRITGPRGSGKTVLLTELGRMARGRGWSVVNVSGRGQLLESIADQIVRESRLQDLNIKVSLPMVSAEVKLGAAGVESFRDIFSTSVRGLTKHGLGLLVTIDEAQDASREQMATIATDVQYMIREQQNVSLLFAGITTGVLDLLNGEGITFLRRAKPEELGNIPLDEVALSLQKTIVGSGLHVEPDALGYMANATHGYAYLIQLVGYYVWREGRRHAAGSDVISLADARRGANVAVDEFGRSVLETAIAGLTRPAINYLFAMTEDEGASSTSAVAARIGLPPASANTYRRILIQRQIIEATAPGYVAFSIPFMRDYLHSNRAAILARYGVVG